MKQMTLLLHYIVVPIKYRISKLCKYISGRPLSYEQTLNNVNTLNFYLHYTVSLSLGTDLIALFLYTSFIILISFMKSVIVGTDEKAIIQVIGHTSNKQRQEILIMFKTMYGKV